MNTNFGKLVDGNLTYAPVEVKIDGKRTFNPTAAHYLAADDGPWKAVSTAQPSEPAPTGYHYEADGWEETDTTITRKWKTVADATIYRKFSKLKIYGAIVSLPDENGKAGAWKDANGKTAWEAVKAWLESKTIDGVNGWMAFQLAQEVSEDNPLFASLSEEARQLLGLTAEQFETLLAACVLED